MSPDAACTDPADLAHRLREAVAAGRAVRATGAGSRPVLPAEPDAGPEWPLSTLGLSRLVAHEPREQTVTVQAGVPLSVLHDELSRHGQWLPGAGRRGTVGGWLACSPDAASDRSRGRPRDRLLGVQAAFSDGTLARGRGQVVKNVAGYDLPRLLAGSLGTLGVLTEVCLKLEPLPAASERLCLDVSELPSALEFLLALHVHALAPERLELHARLTACGTLQDGHLLVGLEGGRRGVAERRQAVVRWAAERRLEVRQLDEAAARQADLDGDEPRGELLLRLPTPPSRLAERLAALATALAHCSSSARLVVRPAPALTLLGLPEVLPAAILASLLTACRQHGSAELLRAPQALAALVDRRGPPPPDLRLMARVKHALDPAGALAPSLGLAGWSRPR